MRFSDKDGSCAPRRLDAMEWRSRGALVAPRMGHFQPRRHGVACLLAVAGAPASSQIACEDAQVRAAVMSAEMSATGKSLSVNEPARTVFVASQHIVTSRLMTYGAPVPIERVLRRCPLFDLTQTFLH